MEQSCLSDLDCQWDEYLHHELFRISEAMWCLEDYVLDTYSHLDAAPASAIVAEVASEVAEDVLRWYEKLITDCFTRAIRLKDFERLAMDHIIHANYLTELAQNEAATLQTDLERQPINAVDLNKDLLQWYIIPAVLGGSVREDGLLWFDRSQLKTPRDRSTFQEELKYFKLVCWSWHKAAREFCLGKPKLRKAAETAMNEFRKNIGTESLGERQD
jgi:hypothetical protein